MAAGTTAVTAVVVLSVWDLGAAAGAGPSKEASPNPDRCGLQFREAAAEALAASQAPPDCATGRLLVFGTEKDSFEGVGSLLIGFAEGLAEAHHSGRSFLFGPQAAHPPVLRSARCPGQGGNRLLWGFDCYFQPLGTCRWEEHVHREEAIAFASGGSWRPESRVAMSHPRRGGPALYTPPPELAAKLPKDLDHAGRAECWAGAVVSYVLRPKAPLQTRLAELEQWLDTSEPFAAVHLRVGDNKLKDEGFAKQDPTGQSRAYSNKPLPTGKLMGQLLRSRLNQEHLPEIKSIFLATDSSQALEARQELASALGMPIGSIKMLERYRTEHGSHNTAFAKMMQDEANKLLVPWTLYGIYASRHAGEDGAARAARDQETVRMEAIEDIWMLSRGAIQAGTASSHFSVLARLLAVGRAHAGAARSPVWLDAAEVASGFLSNGHYHGQVNTTNRLHHPEARMQKALERFLEWPASDRDPPFVLDPTRVIPIIPRGLFKQVSLLWKVPAGADAYCSRCPIPHGCDPVQLVDKGAAFEGSMRPMLAEACWRRALMMPGVASRSTAVDPQTIGEVARSNLKVIIEQSLQTRQAYLQGFEALPRRGSGSGSSSTSRMRIHIEGWRGLPHSFSVVGLDLANHLAMRPGIDLSWSDAPLFGTMARMKHDAGGMQLDPSVAVLPFGGPLPAGTVLVRVSFPFNLTLSATAARTVVFGVVEFLSAQPDALADLSPWQSVASTVVTPSRWAMEGFVRVGVPRSRLALVPHGVDTSLYRPAAGSSDKAAARAALGVSNLGKRFVFLHVSGLSANKKLPKLAAAFDALLTRWPKDAAPSRPALVIKGLSQLYGSESSFRQAVPRRLVDSGDVVYIGKAMVREELARLYQASDAFVTATCGEGFGLPLLEAAAVGLAVVAPAGGAVEEYTTPDFTRYVRSTLVSLAEGSGPIPDGFSISVDTGELSQEMEFVATSREFQDQAAMAGPKHVARYFTIQNVADQLLGMLQDEQWSTPAV